jgi:nucleotide-binding universal stress UspA family protein
VRNVVVGLRADGRPEPALDFALDEARRRRLPLVAVHAYSPPGFGEFPPALFPDRLRALRAEATQAAAAALERGLAAGNGGQVTASSSVVLEVDPVNALLSLADSAAMLVVGTRGGGAVSRGVHGSVAASCLRASQAPVAVVHDGVPVVADRWLRSRVLVGLDGTTQAGAALAWAAAQAREWGSVLVPVVVSRSYVDIPEAFKDGLPEGVWRQVMDAGAGDLEVHPHFVVGRPKAELPKLLSPTDLLVLGTHGHGAMAAALFGGTSSAVALDAPCPVVVVREGQARREIHQRRPEPALP